MTPPLDTVLDRVAAGDAAAMEECVDRYGGLVWSLARRFLNAEADAEDAVQDIFVDLWRSAGRFDQSVASEPTFVATIARRRLIDRKRRQDRRVEASSADPLDPPAPSRTAPEWLALCDEAALVREKMNGLALEQRAVLELAIAGECTHAEIAERLDLPLGTVKTHARRGLIRLRELLTARRPASTAAGGGR